MFWNVNGYSIASLIDGHKYILKSSSYSIANSNLTPLQNTRSYIELSMHRFIQNTDVQLYTFLMHIYTCVYTHTYAWHPLSICTFTTCIFTILFSFFFSRLCACIRDINWVFRALVSLYMFIFLLFSPCFNQKRKITRTSYLFWLRFFLLCVKYALVTQSQAISGILFTTMFNTNMLEFKFQKKKQNF